MRAVLVAKRSAMNTLLLVALQWHIDILRLPFKVSLEKRIGLTAYEQSHRTRVEIQARSRVARQGDTGGLGPRKCANTKGGWLYDDDHRGSLPSEHGCGKDGKTSSQ